MGLSRYQRRRALYEGREEEKGRESSGLSGEEIEALARRAVHREAQAAEDRRRQWAIEVEFAREVDEINRAFEEQQPTVARPQQPVQETTEPSTPASAPTTEFEQAMLEGINPFSPKYKKLQKKILRKGRIV